MITQRLESMPTKKIVIPYFPTGMKFSTPLLLGLAIFLGKIGMFFLSVAVILLGVIILTTKYVTEINTHEKIYRDYLFFLGLAFNEESKKFDGIDRIVVTKGNYAQHVVTRIQSRQMNWSDYTGTLVFSDASTLNLLTRNNKRELLLGLKEFAEFLNAGVEDRTTAEHYWVDIKRLLEDE